MQATVARRVIEFFANIGVIMYASSDMYAKPPNQVSSVVEATVAASQETDWYILGVLTSVNGIEYALITDAYDSIIGDSICFHLAQSLLVATKDLGGSGDDAAGICGFVAPYRRWQSRSNAPVRSVKDVKVASTASTLGQYLSPYREDILAYQKAGITAETELVVIHHLETVGAIDTCYGTGKDCTGGCPSGQVCTKTIRGNCVCSKSAVIASAQRSSSGSSLSQHGMAAAGTFESGAIEYALGGILSRIDTVISLLYGILQKPADATSALEDTRSRKLGSSMLLIEVGPAIPAAKTDAEPTADVKSTPTNDQGISLLGLGVAEKGSSGHVRKVTVNGVCYVQMCCAGQWVYWYKDTPKGRVWCTCSLGETWTVTCDGNNWMIGCW